MFYEYADSGSWTESTYRENESDFTKIKLRQRVAVDITERSLKTEMLGQQVSMPVALAPVGLTGMQHADGEIKAARAAEKFGVPYTLSTTACLMTRSTFEGFGPQGFPRRSQGHAAGAPGPGPSPWRLRDGNVVPIFPSRTTATSGRGLRHRAHE